MAELYTLRPLFPGNSEADQVIKICSIMGSPSYIDWADGHRLAKQIGYSFPKYKNIPLSTLIPNGNKSAIDLMIKML